MAKNECSTCNMIWTSIWSNFSTLQQQLAERNRAFSLTSNSTMYTGGPLSDADIALLPHISWSQITLLNFLGQGAFGEVYEGMLKHQDQEEEEKVAIKVIQPKLNL
ncbi:hypothetical protein DOY81_004563 [Sarcophaga bullata]|nr:hypothetical protein DOY81_004563 [Sarcophaga bullata]